MVKVLGVQRKIGEGVIDGIRREWDNIILHCVSDSDGSVVGLGCMPLKVKSVAFKDVTGYAPEDGAKLVDHEVNLVYLPSLNGRTELVKIEVVE